MFALAQSPLHITLAMGLIGAGCAPVLMASYYIFARVYSPAVFATLAAASIGIGSLGNIAGSLPIAMAVEAFGWRATMWALAVLCGVIAVMLALVVQDPEKVEHDQKGSIFDLLKMPVLWPIMAITLVNYMPAAGLRGLWAGPYAADVFGAGAVQIGQMTLVMGIAMIIGSFAYGPLDRILGTRKWLVFGGNAISALACFALWRWADHSMLTATILLATVGFFGVSYPVLIAHARSFFPTHLIGRGVTLLNLLSIGGVGLMQLATGRIFKAAEATATNPADPYRLLFAFFGILLVLGLLAYLPARDSRD